MSILLLLFLSLQVTARLGLLGWYRLDTRNIARKHCVNKNRPGLHCNGRCHLKKQLNKIDNGCGKGSSTTGHETVESPLFLPEERISLPRIVFPAGRTYADAWLGSKGIGPLQDVFRPPAMA